MESRRCRDGEAVPRSEESRLGPGRRPRTPLPILPQGSPGRGLSSLQPGGAELSCTQGRAEKQHPGEVPSALQCLGGQPGPILYWGVKTSLQRKTTQRITPGQELTLQRGFSSPRQSPSLRKSWKEEKQELFPKGQCPWDQPYPRYIPLSARCSESALHFFCCVSGLAFTPREASAALEPRSPPEPRRARSRGQQRRVPAAAGGARRRIWLPAPHIESRSSGETNPARRTRGLCLF